MNACRFSTSGLFYSTVLLLSTTLASGVTIPAWNVTSSTTVGHNITYLSQPDLDTTKWYKIGSKATLMATLLENDVYNETDLFFSTNLQKVGFDEFRVPWYYRSELSLDMKGDAPDYMERTDPSYYTLQTHGISSRADIWLNGKLVVGNDVQAGAYTGLALDVTPYLNFNSSPNILLVKAYPTDYNRDFALGFVDWNPYPPDNGTGIWRDVELKRTGSIDIGSPRVVIGQFLDGTIHVHLDVKNLGKDAEQTAEIWCTITDPKFNRIVATADAMLSFSNTKINKIKFELKISEPRIWWPAQSGAQPLYTVSCGARDIHTYEEFSFTTSRFGIRKVTSTFDPVHNDTTFHINGEPFQVLGAGYTSDMFLRFSPSKVRAQLDYTLSMGLNTIRLEGKQEHSYLYDLADEMGIMLLPGWECCDKWEGWNYNDEGSGEKWTSSDYDIAKRSMSHEAKLMQTHPSVLGFLVGSDYWPDDRATKDYVDALGEANWQTPIISSASQRGAPALLGNGGMKMDGPYDWVPPNYWFDSEQRLGAAGGFGSELGAGVGTPEISSLKKFLSESDMRDLWSEEAKDKGLYHMSTNVSSFYTRQIYNEALWSRMGKPTSLEDYVRKAQIMDYEATQAQFDAYLSRWNQELERPATGLVYWMLNNAWPSLHWNLFDYYLHPAGSFFGTQAALGSTQNVVLDPVQRTVYLVDRRAPLERNVWGSDRVDMEVINLDGEVLVQKSIETRTQLNAAKKIAEVPGLKAQKDIVLLRLQLYSVNESLARRVYWITPEMDVMDWDNSTWYHTPVTKFSDLSPLFRIPTADVDVKTNGRTVLWDNEIEPIAVAGVGVMMEGTKVFLENKSKYPAMFVQLNLVDGKGQDVLPVVWSQNYVTLWPGEKMEIDVRYEQCCHDGVEIEISGVNVEKRKVVVGGL